MNREEAIKCIEKYLCRIIGTVSEQDFVKALDMAIEALKVDLVRCGECKYRDCCFELNDKVEADDYCSCGERRSDG